MGKYDTKNRKKLKQRDIFLVNLSPTVGHEQSGLRPAVIISGNAYHNFGIVMVSPLTTQIKNINNN